MNMQSVKDYKTAIIDDDNEHVGPSLDDFHTSKLIKSSITAVSLSSDPIGGKIEKITSEEYNFEDNRKYNDEISSLCTPNNFSGVSQALAIKKTIELKEEYEKEQNIKYDIVILYRYDVLLWKNMILNEYESIFDNDIYVNAHSDCNGDFHFVMNNNNSYEFKYLYDSIKLGNACIMHYWIKNYVLNFMKKTIIMDKIVPGKNQEVIRKIPPHNVVINFG